MYGYCREKFYVNHFWELKGLFTKWFYLRQAYKHSLRYNCSRTDSKAELLAEEEVFLLSENE